MDAERARKIAAANDNFRSGPPASGQWFITAAVNARGPAFVLAAILKVRTFKDFTKGNDPYGERDFGSFDLAGEKLFFKIDLYDQTLTNGSEDPLDDTKTKRIMTIGFMSDY